LQAIFICDLHARLATSEVIGLLGGTYDPSKQELAVLVAIPCEAEQEDNYATASISVDTSAQSALEVLCFA
jgi:hypothetical protein